MSDTAKDGCLPRLLRLSRDKKNVSPSSVTPASAPQSLKAEVTANQVNGLLAPPIQSGSSGDSVPPPSKIKPSLTLSADDNLPYRLRKNFLSATELEFYEALKISVQAQVVVMVKVRLADIFDVNDRHENTPFFYKISQKHVDFLLCHLQTLKPLCGIELDDRSHRSPERMRRDSEVDIIFSTVELPLLRFRARREYSIPEISSRIARFLTAMTDAESPVEIKVVAETISPSCPVCGSQMILRTARQGKHQGKNFWGCIDRDCRGIIDASEADDAPLQ